MVFNNSILLGAAGQGGAASFDTTLIGNAIWLDGQGTSGDAMTRTWGSQSNQDRWIWATWFQPLRAADATANRNAIFASGTGAHGFALTHTSTDSSFNIFHRDNSGNEGAVNTTESYRDLTSWIHVLVDYDSANAIAENRISLYVNGVRTGVNSGTRPGQNNDLQVNVSGQTAHIAQNSSTTPNYHMQGLLAQTVFLDNKSIANSDLAITDFLDTFTFGTNGSQIIPKSNTDIIALASAAGANSFCLDYSDANNIVNDASSKGNNFTPTGGGSPTITSDNQTLHTPSLSYPVFNALCPSFTNGGTWSEGNTKIVSTSEETIAITTLPSISTGKYYFQWVFTDNASSGNCNIGMVPIDAWDGKTVDYNDSNIFFVSHRNSLFQKGPSTSVTGILGSSGTYALCFDLDEGKVWAGLVNTSDGSISWYDSSAGTTGDPANGTNPTATFTANTAMVPFTNVGKAGGTSWTVDWNFGQFGFGNSAVPTGFEQITSTKVAAPDFQGIDYFDATIYEGNGNGQRVGDFVPFTDAYTVDNSAMFDDGDTRILSRTFGTADSLRKMTFSTWAKWANPAGSEQIIFSSGTSLSNRFEISFASADNITIFSKVSNSTVLNLGSEIDVADTSQWVNIVLSIDTDQSSTAERYRLFIDGVQQTLTGTDSIGNADIHLNSAIQHNIGGRDGGLATAYFDGYFAETVFIDNARLDASSFGQLDTSTNRWVPKSVSGLTFGANGFYLEYEGDFSSTSLGNDAGKDTSGRSNHFTQEGSWAASDKFTDTPSKNYATYDTVKGGVHTAMSMSEGNLTTKDGNGSVALAAGFPIQEGYWYYEVNTIEDVNNMIFGLYNPATTVTASTSNPSLSGIQVSGGTVIMQNNGGSNSSPGPTLSNPSAGDVVGIYIRKVKNNYGMWFSLNGTAMSNTPAATETATPDISFAATIELVPAVHYSNPGTKEAQTNFGQLLQFDGGATSFNAASDGYWKHAPVTGFKALNQDNLDDTASKLTAWAWIKNRDADDSHILVDRVRGVGEVLHSDATDLEATEPNTVQRFLQRGVQVGNDVQVNTANESYVLWQWLVGEAATTTTINASSTTPTNSIASTVAAADAGHFSVVGYQGNSTNGATVAHSLGGAPELIFFRGREGSGASSFIWRVFSTAGGAGKYLRLNDTTALQDDTAYLNNTLPGSVVFTLGTDGDVNNSNYTYVAYCFRSIPGMCKVGSYEGNNNGDGSYISLGFTPAWFMAKNIDASGSWFIIDNKRGFNSASNEAYLQAESTATETVGNVADLLADGIKWRTTGGGNASNTFIYIAMADIAGNGTLPPIYGR